MEYQGCCTKISIGLPSMQFLCSLQSSEIRLLEGRIQEIATDPGAEKNYQVDLRGGYIVIETNQGMNFMWDQKTTVVVHVAPSFQVGMGWTDSYVFKLKEWRTQSTEAPV